MKRILPPTLLLLSIGLMILLYFILPIHVLFRFPYSLIGIPILLIGIIISILGSAKFEKEETTSMTFDEPNVLVVSGLYKYTRNPMYLGFALFIIGIWLLMSSISSAFIAIIFLIVLDRYYIPFEEKMLEKKFGQDYLSYKKRVRKWI